MTSLILPSHLTKAEQEALSQFLARLREVLPDQIQHVILFGSKARGDSMPESDIDVLVVLDSDDWRLRRQVCNLAVDANLENNVLITTHTFGHSHFVEIGRRRTPFYRNVTSEGIELWTKSHERISSLTSN